MNKDKDFSLNEDDNFKQKQLDRRRQNRKKIQKQKKMRKRRILFFVIVAFVILLIIKFISSIFSNKKAPVDISNELTLPTWYLSQFEREKSGILDNSMVEHKTLNDKMFIAYDNATGVRKTLVKGSNHISSVSNYAYDTKEIRQYIRGEKEYTGKDKLVFLTFDDGPNETITPQILSTLDKNNVRATFFLVGKNITQPHYSTLKRAVMNGNSLAIHSFSHDYSALYPGRSANANKIIEEARLTEGRMQKVFGDDFSSKVWRYPGGHMSWDKIHSSDEILEQDNYQWIDWNCLTGDAERKQVRPTNTQEQINYLSKSLHQNLHSDVAVVLMHDAKNKQLTADSLQAVIDYFKENNYKFCILK